MGTRIEAAVTAVPMKRRWFERGALRLSDRAAIACLHRAHHNADELDLLINAGIYKDFGAAEPALASIIQDDIAANPGPPRLGHHGTFSFDVLNGGCGFISAAQVVDGFVDDGRARLGMIVAGDADPAPRTSRGFAFSPAGGAVLISYVDGDSGFRQFTLRTFPEHAALFESALRWDPRAGLARRGRNVLEVRSAPEIARVSIACAARVIRDVLATDALVVEGIDLWITSQYPAGFAMGLAEELGIPRVRVPRVRRELAAAHTAGPIAALEVAIENGSFARARQVMFVTAGAGLTIGVARYERGAMSPSAARA